MTNNMPQVGRSRFPSVRSGAFPRRAPVEQMVDNFGNAFTLQTTAQSSIAQRRDCRRSALDLEAARSEHQTAWQQYVRAHEGKLEEQADTVRQAARQVECEEFLLDHPGPVTFGTIDYEAQQQPRSVLAKLSDGRLVSPRTEPSEREKSIRELPLSLRADAILKRYTTHEGQVRFYSLADLEPADFEAQTGLSLRGESPVCGPVMIFMQAVGSVVKDILLG
ncbi:hypothetical protein LTR36_005416 [Oleoguttula mirabilis]|uniref:Uncharacterized protein n=1 Tax=Oleoguttula mirabilis TaxID=1507867 RepID=A0AAV9JEB0_9PEZI|nr:hypothetical protein LTR36_005416 [Oleoguttula mirabilis]